MKVIKPILLVVATGILGCEQRNHAVSQTPQSTAVTFRPLASVQEIMLSVIDPNIDPIWNSISTISTAEGVVEKRPQTEEEWAQLERHAIALQEAANLLLIEGRKVAHEGNKTSIHHSELHAPEIEKAIAENRQLFNQLVHGFQDAAGKALSAIREKNVEALEAAGEAVEAGCEACHSRFWYPGDKRPTQ